MAPSEKYQYVFRTLYRNLSCELDKHWAKEFSSFVLDYFVLFPNKVCNPLMSLQVYVAQNFKDPYDPRVNLIQMSGLPPLT